MTIQQDCDPKAEEMRTHVYVGERSCENTAKRQGTESSKETTLLEPVFKLLDIRMIKR